MKSFIVSLLVLTFVVFFVTEGRSNSPYVAGIGKEHYVKGDNEDEKANSTSTEVFIETATTIATTTAKVTHVQTPEHVKAIYMSSWVAGTPSIRERLVKLIDETELNAVVIDVKDNTGVLTWDERAKDIDAFVEELHKKNIYVIARISVFQDPAYVKKHPELAVQNIKTGGIWKDHKGVPWIDTGSRQVWEYAAEVGKEAYERGFDELNYDYIRFPTDGDLKAMRFPVSGDRALTDKPGIVGEFYKYLYDEFKPLGIPISGDLFGIIATNNNETKTLGQDLRDAYKYFDYVALMVYPSHYYKGTAGFDNPAAHPYEIIDYATLGAVAIAEETASSTRDGAGVPLYATSTLIAKLRPWYQDFDMGATYTAQMVRAQIKAGEKHGVHSWMLWDPSNKYTKEALLPQ
jgi:hypothetical protein